MRIISGKHRGKIIKAPVKLPVRPTTDMAKESLFNVLMNWFDLEEIRVLDLFAGTGNLSYEFASRGAQSIVAVDIHKGCVEFIGRMAEELGYTQLKAVKGDSLNYVRRNFDRCDVIVADPPYDWDGHLTLVETIMSGMLLDTNGVFVLEHGREHDFSDHPDFLNSRKYGSVHFTFFARETAD